MGDHCPIQPSKGHISSQAARLRSSFVNQEVHKLYREGRHQEAFKLQDDTPSAMAYAKLPGERGGSTFSKQEILINPEPPKKERDGINSTIGPPR